MRVFPTITAVGPTSPTVGGDTRTGTSTAGRLPSSNVVATRAPADQEDGHPRPAVRPPSPAKVEPTGAWRGSTQRGDQPVKRGVTGTGSGAGAGAGAGGPTVVVVVLVGKVACSSSAAASSVAWSSPRPLARS